jgi:hypothetical protein
MLRTGGADREQPSLVLGAGPAVPGRSFSRARDAIQRIA